MFCAVAPCPVNVSQVRLGLQEFRITWTPPISEEFSSLGYQAFYESSDGIKQNTTFVNADNVTLKGLTLGETYVVTVLSFGAEFVLPSAHCENITVVAGKGCHFI